jgi:hypothetical protein
MQILLFVSYSSAVYPLDDRQRFIFFLLCLFSAFVADVNYQ